MVEIRRRDFLLNRDGVSKTIEFYRQALKCYRRAAEMAAESRQPNERRIVARGREWAEKYREAAFECRIMLKSLRKKICGGLSY